MLRAFLTIIILFSSQISLAQSQEMREAWQRAGYNLQALFAEPDFQPHNCMRTEKIFTACVMTLSSILKKMDEDPQELFWDVASQSLQTRPASAGEILDYDEFLVDQQNQYDQFSQAFFTIQGPELTQLFEYVFNQAHQGLAEFEQFHIAGTAYGQFLRQAYDPRMNFTPRSQFGPQPRTYFGIGAHVSRFENTQNLDIKGAIAVKPMPGSPALNAGLKQGDLILAVGDTDVREMDFREAIELVLGEEGTIVPLTIMSLCDNTQKVVNVTRGPISHQANWLEESHFVSLTDDMSADPVARICEGVEQIAQGVPQALYVPLTTFMERPGQDLCREFVSLQIKDLRNPDSQGMIIDLRGNGGGNLDAVACMLDSLIVDDGPLVGQIPVRFGEIVDGAQPRITHRFSPLGYLSIQVPVESASTGSTQMQPQRVTYNRNVVVLVDDFSASASEIFAGTIQEMQRGWVVGDRTVGKGSVQSVGPHRNPVASQQANGDSVMIARTTAIYTLNSGWSPQQVGIIPDFRYTQWGEPITDPDDFVTKEAQSFGSIPFNNPERVLARPGDADQVAQCATQSGSVSDRFLSSLNQDERYARTFVANYQMKISKDVLACSPARLAYL
jgi:C-terminal processing protease CtpA/Prc